MRRLIATLVLPCLSIQLTASDKIDRRLATVRRAYIASADDLGDDRQVAACVADRLTRVTPIEIVKTRDEADVILIVSKASVGKRPKAHLEATLPNGTHLWDGGSKARTFNLVGRNMTCVIADDLLSNLRKAMRKASKS